MKITYRKTSWSLSKATRNKTKLKDNNDTKVRLKNNKKIVMKNGEITGFISKELNQYKESGINLEYTVMLLQLTDVQNTNSSILVFA